MGIASRGRWVARRLLPHRAELRSQHRPGRGAHGCRFQGQNGEFQPGKNKRTNGVEDPPGKHYSPR
eukprot:7771161-Lingulodinium_polyedra.AAC.1